MKKLMQKFLSTYFVVTILAFVAGVAVADISYNALVMYLVNERAGKMVIGTTGEFDIEVITDQGGDATKVHTFESDGSFAPAGDLQLASGYQLDLDTGTIAAAGSDDTDGTAIVDQVTYVTGADGSKGVELPAGAIGECYLVHNTHATNELKIYPPALGQLNGLTATTGNLVIAGQETGIYCKVSSTLWYGTGTDRRIAGSLAVDAAVTAGTGLTATTGDVVLSASGSLRYQEATAGTKCMGTVTANGTTAVPVSTTCALTASRIFISRTSVVAAGVTEPGCWATNIVNATSFDLDCNDAAEDSTFNWFIVNESA